MFKYTVCFDSTNVLMSLVIWRFSQRKYYFRLVTALFSQSGCVISTVCVFNTDVSLVELFGFGTAHEQRREPQDIRERSRSGNTLF